MFATAGRISVFGVRRPLIGATLLVSLLLASAAAVAQGRTGKEVVQQVCAACHGTGAQGAPKIGDKGAWSKLSASGLSTLTRIALAGIRKMPPHGGQPSLNDLDIRRAITYMVNESGGAWIEPVGKSSRTRERSGEEIVRVQCSKCHQAGVGGAPKIGDRSDWIPRMQQGLDAVVRSAINGHGAMPARGGLANLTDTEMRNAVVYMFNPGRPAAKK